MAHVLVFGGTRFFGKKTVEHFIRLGYEVTIATRGRTQDDFGTQVKRILLDRQDSSHIGWQEIAATDWELVFDNICYTWEDAKIALDHLGAVGHYLVTSSLAVYEGIPGALGFTEEQFAPLAYDYSPSDVVSYGEGKRQVEAYFEAQRTFPVTYLRFPVVLDDDDYTERLDFYIRRSLTKQDIVFKRDSGRLSFVQASEIPLAIQFIIERNIEGPINISSGNPFSLSQFVTHLKQATRREPQLICDGQKEPSPFAHYDLPMDVTYLATLGYPVTSLSSWLPDLMTRLTRKESNITPPASPENG